MSQQLINIGTTANDGTGDTLRTAFDKINDNFTEVYSNALDATSVEADTTPQLGGNLDVNGHVIISNGNGNIKLLPAGTGAVFAGNVKFAGGTTGIESRTVTSAVTDTSLYLRGNGVGSVDIANIRASTGTIDNVIIGNTTPTSAKFTTINASGAVGISGNVTLSGTTTATGSASLSGNVSITGDRTVITGELRVGTDVNSAYPVSFSSGLVNPPSQITDGTVRLHLQSADNKDTTLLLESFGTGRNIVVGSCANGTASFPEAVVSGDTLLRLFGRGWNGSDYSGSRAEIRFVAGEDWDLSNQGSNIRFYTTSAGSVDLTEVGRFTSNGKLQLFNTSNSVDITSGALQVDGGIAVAKDIHGGGDLHVLGDVYAQTNLIINGRAQFEEIDISYNRIEATVTNGNILLVPNGTGCVTVDGPLRVDGQECVFGTATIDGLAIGDNSIESLATNGPLNLISNGTGKINFLGQVRYVNINVPSTSVGQYGDETGDICVDETYIYYCTADYDGSTDVWKRIQWSGDTW